MLKNKTKKATAITALIIFIFAPPLLAQNPFEVISNVLDNAVFVSSNLPTSLRAGQTYSASITFRNTGLHTWDLSEPYKLALYDLNDNSYQSDVWGVRTVSLPYAMHRDDKVTFIFDIKAPYRSGVYNSRWSMTKDNIFFGEPSAPLLISVSGEENVQLFSYRGNSSQFLNQSVPSSMIPGQRYKVLLTMKNTGTSTWYPSYYGGNTYGYRLVSVSDYTTARAGTDWGISPVSLAYPVEPGKTVTFELEPVAPSSTGTYNFQWQMMLDGNYFGEKSASIPVTVSYDAGRTEYSTGNNASFVDLSVPTYMVPGEKYKGYITLRNTGTTAWTPYNTYGGEFKLVSIGTPYTDWGISPINLRRTVEPGSSITYEFDLRAPATPGNYTFQWQMMQGGSYFGEKTSPAAIVIGSGNYGQNYGQPVPYYNTGNNASFEDQSVPATMKANRSYRVYITFVNNGTNTWTRGVEHLMYYSDPRLARLTINPWGIERLELPYDIAPGSSVTFSFRVKAPPSAGSYPFQWQMMGDMRNYDQSTYSGFGEPSALVNVTVRKSASQY